ncbi:bifunctional diguanylate cyclase/phosphodiesterase [Halomonas alkalicola]|uniref:EAL domain-containing protein n=1 Tax=Halomonas alkalicola TaxID=1930622 RepID=A0ABY9H839_9GAMM|nr:EAL domain-containing protein [Halomonas alkalicola]WLI74646.1 EAL domain-containing protein [Halomonas alkalicola]
MIEPDAQADVMARQRARRDRRVAIALYILGMLMLFGSLGGFLFDQYQRDMQAARERTAARADLVAEWVASIFSASDFSLSTVSQLMQPPQRQRLFGDPPDPERIEPFLAQQLDRLGFVDEISLVDPEGQVVASSSSLYPPGFDVSGLPFYRTLRSAPERAEWISPIHWSALEQRHVVVHARRLPDGQGLALVELDPGVFGEALERLSLTRGESIAIIDTEMQLVARRPRVGDEHSPAVLGVSIDEPHTRAFIASGAPSATLKANSPLDGGERLYTFQRVDDLPFVVVVGEAREVLLGDWLHRLWVRVMIGLAVMGLGWLALRHYLNRLRLEEEVRRQALERELARREVQARESRLQALVGSIRDMIFVFDGEGRFSYIHAPDPDELMTEAAAVLQRPYREVLPPAMAAQLDQAFAALRQGGEPVEYDYTLPIGGEPRQFHSVLSPLLSPGEAPAEAFGGALAVVRDVTEERATEAQLRIAATPFETHLGMLITDGEGRILKVNDTFTRITGYREAEVLGRNPRLLSSGLHEEAFYRRLWRSVVSSGSWQGEVWNRRKNGEVFPEWLTLSAVRNAAGTTTHFVATFSDLTERKAAEQKIHQLAFFDPLTGLPNRRLMLDRLEVALKDSYRSGEFGALMFLDLDHFKQVNDTLGHHAGDQLLQAVAQRLEGVLRDTDTVARLGSDEFAILLHDLGTELEEVAVIAERVAHKLLAVMQAPMSLGEERLGVSVSVGVTLYRDHETTLDEILQQADLALFQAKAAGRNTLAFFDPEMQVRLQARARLEADLRQALPKGELRLYYQPQVDERGVVIGVEALVRWQHPVRGQVSPGEFIPLAEENRLIVAIGHWVLETACRQLAAWAADPARSALSLSVNVSPRQFREPDFVDRVLETLEATGAPASRLKLEVTESLLLEARDEARSRMLELRARGVGFALDDFGTGYSSLAYLKRLPLDQLKIDQSFVRDLLEDEASEAIVASTIALAQSLKLEVVAEGVETEAQRAWLLAHGCRAFQGYLFGRPVAVEALELDA